MTHHFGERLDVDGRDKPWLRQSKSSKTSAGSVACVFFLGQTWKFLAGKIMGNCHTWRFLAGKKYGNKWRLPKGSPTKRWTPYRKKSNLPG